MTVSEVLGLPCLARAQLVAGHSGAARRVRVVNIMEVPDIVRWMRGGELLLTTAYPVKDDASALLRLITALDERGVAALGIKFGPYLSASPEGMFELADRRQFPLIEIPPDVIFNDVLSEVLGTILNQQALELERTVHMHQRLTQVMLQWGSIVELIRALSQIIDLPAAIIDTQGRVLAEAGGAPVRRCGERGDHAAGQREVRAPIMLGATPGGEVVVWPGAAPLQARDMMTIEQAATMAAVAMAQERALLSREQRHRALFLMELTSGRPVNRADATRRAAAMGWDLDVPRAVILVDLATESGPLRVAGQPVEEQLSRVVRAAAGARSVVWALQSGLAVLAEPKPSVGTACASIRKALATEFPRLRAMIGAGGVCESPEELQRSYGEAVEAVTLGRQLYGKEFIVRNEELGVYRILGHVPEPELRKHCDEVLGPLLAYDERHHGSLVRTLEVYLGCGSNRVEAARELCIHYNTLRYRLDVIARLTGGIDRDATSRLGLEMALHAQRLLLSRRRTRPTFRDAAQMTGT